MLQSRLLEMSMLKMHPRTKSMPKSKLKEEVKAEPLCPCEVNLCKLSRKVIFAKSKKSWKLSLIPQPIEMILKKRSVQLFPIQSLIRHRFLWVADQEPVLALRINTPKELDRKLWGESGNATRSFLKLFPFRSRASASWIAISLPAMLLQLF